MLLPPRTGRRGGSLDGKKAWLIGDKAGATPQQARRFASGTMEFVHGHSRKRGQKNPSIQMIVFRVPRHEIADPAGPAHPRAGLPVVDRKRLRDDRRYGQKEKKRQGT